jgi:hypothetical protein
MRTRHDQLSKHPAKEIAAALAGDGDSTGA